jgi:hypothetical protein
MEQPERNQTVLAGGRRLGVALMIAHGTVAAPGAGQAPQRDVFAVLQTLDEIGGRKAWPGFALSDWPIAVFGRQSG